MIGSQRVFVSKRAIVPFTRHIRKKGSHLADHGDQEILLLDVACLNRLVVRQDFSREDDFLVLYGVTLEFLDFRLDGQDLPSPSQKKAEGRGNVKVSVLALGERGGSCPI